MKTKRPDGEPVRWVIVTAECLERIAALTTPGHEFRQTGVKQPDGRFRIPLAESTVERIISVSLPGEAVGDTILRVVSTQKGAN